MSLGLTYDQLTPVSGTVRAGMVAYNGNNLEHRSALRGSLPRFLGEVAAVHGESFPHHQLETIIEIANAKEIEIEFCLVGFEACRQVSIAGLATGAPTFGIERDRNNNLRIVPVKHGEDLCVDKDMAKLFREHTRSSANPQGIGLGTWFMREQIRRSVTDPDWVLAGRDNEHSPDNQPIIGLMDKFGAVRGTERDSAVLQIDEPTYDMRRRWGVDVKTQALPADALGINHCPNNFLTRWSSEDGKQQIAVTYTKLPSVLDNQTVVWTKIKSNGNLPDAMMLKEVLASLLKAGSKEISSPERKWGIPRNELTRSKDLIGRTIGWPTPVMHIHANNEPEIVQTLLEMEAERRKYGHGSMVSGVINPRNVPDQVAAFGQKIPEATLVRGIDLGEAANGPCFDLGPKIPIGQVHTATWGHKISSLNAA